MGSDRALNVVALQSLLMTGARDHADLPGVVSLKHRVLATAASLDYVLMLATQSAGARISPGDAERAIHDGIARGVDDAIALTRAILDARRPGSQDFAREAVRTVRATIADEQLADNERAFAMIALASDAGL